MDIDNVQTGDLESSSLNIFALDETDSDLIAENLVAKKEDQWKAKQIVKYSFYKSQNPLIKDFTEHNFDITPYHNWTETRFFAPDQIQDAAFEVSAQEKWLISDAKKV